MSDARVSQPARGRAVHVAGDPHAVTVRWSNFQGGWGLKAVMIVVVAAPAMLCIAPALEIEPPVCGVACGVAPLVLAVVFVLALAGGSVQVTLSARGLERRGVSGLGVPSSSFWPCPVAVQIAPLWSFDSAGAVTGVEQFNVGFFHGPGLPIDSLVLDHESAAALAAGVLKLNTPGVTLDARGVSRAAPSALCVACGYDLLGTPVPRCPECGTPVDANRFEVLRRMHQAGRDGGANQPPPLPVQEQNKEPS